MNNNYEIIRTIFENEFQRILECKNNNGEIFHNNVITQESIIKFIDIKKINTLYGNIIDCYKTQDRVYILTKPLEFENIKEYVNNNNLTLKQQFMLSKNIIKLSSDIYDMKDIVQQKILDYNCLYIDENGQVVVDFNMAFEQEYDISENETFKRMANILHYIFSKKEIEDYNISELVPPDMLKIIVRCLTKEYLTPGDTLKELNNSPIYNMINSGSNNKDKEKTENNKTNKIVVPLNTGGLDIGADENINNLNYNNEYRKEFIPDDEGIEGIEEDDLDTKNIFDIYLNDSSEDEDLNSNSNKNSKKGKYNKNIVIVTACILLILLIERFITNKVNSSENVSNNNPDSINVTNNNDNNITDGDKNQTGSGIEVDDTKESTSKFFNDSIIKNVNYTGVVAGYDNNIYVEGRQSLIVKNDTDDKVKALFAVVDFNNEDYSYMLKRQIGIALKTKSENDTSALIILEAYKDKKLSSTFHTTIQVYDDMWSPSLVPINVTNADLLYIYIEYTGKNKIWIDALDIDVIK